MSCYFRFRISGFASLLSHLLLAPLVHRSSLVLAIAAGLDYWIGDPWGWLHPVQVMGWVITHCTRFVLHRVKQAMVLRLTGILLGAGVILLSGAIAWLIVTGATVLHPLFGLATESILLASCFAGRSLRAAAEDVLGALQAGDLTLARSRLSLYVGRDTEALSEPEVLRAVMETVTENAVDGMLAPLFYAIVGAAIAGVGSAPIAIAYKAASTLDSSIGYREAPYTDLGWFSAKTEDLLTWLPCRLTVLTLSLLSVRPGHVWRLCLRDAPKDASPNSGWSECAYAAVLGVQMGGTNSYRGVVKQKPLLGDLVYPITVERIDRALQLTRYSSLLWLLGAVGGFLFLTKR